MPTPCKYFSPSKLLRNYSKTKPFPSNSFLPREQNHLFKIPFLSFSIPSSSMSLRVSAVPCLLPSSPQPSHAHTHPLQLFFPFEITQKLLQNKAISAKLLFFPLGSILPCQNTPIPKHSHAKTPTAPQKHPQTYTSLKPLLKAFHLHSPNNLTIQILTNSPYNPGIPHNLTTLKLQSSQSYNFTILFNPSSSSILHPHNLTILTLHPTILQQSFILTILQQSFILTILQQSFILTTPQPHNHPHQSASSSQSCNPAILTLHPTILHR